MPINQVTKCKHCGVEHKLRGYSCTVCKNGVTRYKMTRLDMIALHEKQNKKCAICEKELELFIDRKGGFIDHCHITGTVRGILCITCNTAVGQIEKISLEKIKSYLFR
jgi:hypothetical protein